MITTLSRVVGWHRPLMIFAGLMAVTGVAALAGYVVDTRTLDGVAVWAKPLKFAVSFAVYAVTLAWLVSRLQAPRSARAARLAGTAVAGAATGEMVAIVLQAARGRRSHFNTSTAFDTAVYGAMGVLVTVIFVATLAVAVALLRESPVGDPAVTWSLRLGLAISLAGMAVGFLMVTPRAGQDARSPVTGGHAVGGGGGHVVPLLGWDTSGGDLRIPHFVGMHALQVVPLLAAALTVLPATRRLAGDVRVRLVLVTSAGYLAVFAVLLGQALRGQAVTAPDRWTVTALGAVAAGVAAAATATLRRGRPGKRSSPILWARGDQSAASHRDPRSRGRHGGGGRRDRRRAPVDPGCPRCGSVR